MKKRRATALILSALILSSAFCGCSYKEIPNKTTTEATNKIEITTENPEPMTNPAIDGSQAQLTPTEDPETTESPTHPQVEVLMVDFHTYDSIISTYRKIVELCPQYERFDENAHFLFFNDDAKKLYDQLFFSTLHLYPHNAKGIDGNCYNRFGYTVKDLNNDGINELILGLDNHQVIAIFSMINNAPVLLASYYNRNNCWIDPDGYLHVKRSNGANQVSNQIYGLEKNTCELILLEEFGTDGHDETNGEIFFYKLLDNEKIYLLEEEYISFKKNLPYAKIEECEIQSNYMNFVPIFNEIYPIPHPYTPPSKG